MNLPISDELNIGYLSRVFDRNRISNSYKYFWMSGILNIITKDRTTFTYDELLNEMIIKAWYMVTEYKLRLGPCNTTDNLEEIVKYIAGEYHLASTEKEESIRKILVDNSDSKINRYKNALIVNVPYCLQSPFYGDIKSPNKGKIEEINNQKHLLYYFAKYERLKTTVIINKEWVGYLVRNKEILKDWVNYNLIGYLQDRNPSVPGIADKLAKPEKRNLTRVTNYWKLLIGIDSGIEEIYKDGVIVNENISIDHFVPWQFVAHDELWNLSPTTKSINSQKGNRLPDWNQYFDKLAKLEYRAYNLCADNEMAMAKFNECAKYHINSLEVRNSLYQPGLSETQFSERLQNVLKPVYDSARLSGFDQWQIKGVINGR